MNSTYGTYEDLPFDLRGKTIISYFLKSESSEKATERKKLESVLEESIRLMVKDKIQNPLIDTLQNQGNSNNNLSQADRIQKTLEYRTFRNRWLTSEEAVSDAGNAVLDLFDRLEEIYYENEDVHKSLAVGISRDDKDRSPHFWFDFRKGLYLRFS